MVASGPTPRVIIIGGGFGGLSAAHKLAGQPAEVLLIDKRNHHLFQPLLYQVAMAGLSPADIAMPIRSILRDAPNIKVILAHVDAIDAAARTVRCGGASYTYGHLIVAAGAQTAYFGHDAWRLTSLGLKDLHDALDIRHRVLSCFERAETEPDASARRALLTFVVIGGGPTGVELAGALAELSRFVLKRDFRAIDPSEARVILLEAGGQILPSFPAPLPAKALASLQKLGVEVRLQSAAQDITATGVELAGQRIPAHTVIWAAGVKGVPLLETLHAPLDRAGRVITEADCSIPGHPEVLVIGDGAAFTHQPGWEGRPLPGIAPVAIQQGEYAGAAVLRALRGEARKPFVYFDKGTMATIGRSSAVAVAGKLKLSGFLAWLAWLFIHIMYLVGFRNRVSVMLNWFWYYLMYKPGARLITASAGPPAPGGSP